MSCRRSHEIDLPGFLEEAGAETFRAFREHYPRCVDCSAEVRAWTDLQLKLRGSDLSHPEPDVLLRFSDSRETLGREQQGRVERHIASCAACRDELETLKHFDFPALNEPASGTEAAPWLSGLTDWLRRALWHPGLAYALVLILAIPLVAENWQATRIETLVANDRVAAIESLSKTQDGAPAADLKQKSRTELRISELQEKPEAAAKPNARSEHLAANAPTESFQALRALGYIAATEPHEEPAEAFASRAPAQVRAPAMPLRAQAEASRGETHEDLTSLKRARMVSPQRIEPPAQTLSTRANGALLELRLPNPTGVEPGDELDVRIFRTDGSRELGEHLAAGANGFTLLKIPADWLGSGRHRVEIRIRKDPPGARRTLEYQFTAP